MRRILIADDSPIMRRNLRTILEQAGFDAAAEASNGEEAVQAYRRHRPDLVTMDITMPVMDGIEAVRRIVAEDPAARILVISAFDRRRMLFDAMEAGAAAYLIKPITADKLLQAIRPLAAAAGGDAESPAAAEQADRASAPDEPLFRIANEDGRFVVDMPNPYRIAMLDELQTAIGGLLFVQPLAVTFVFGGAPGCHAELPPALESIIGRIRGAGGTVRVSAMHERLAADLRQSLSVPIEAN